MRTPEWIIDDGSSISLSLMTSAQIMNVLTYIARGTGEFGPLTRPRVFWLLEQGMACPVQSRTTQALSRRPFLTRWQESQM